MIEPIIKMIEMCADEELTRANMDNPPFRSKHEALGVLSEEVWEAVNEVQGILEEYDTLKEDVYRDCDNDIPRSLEQLRLYAVAGASELVQVIAMCNKWKRFIHGNL